MRVIAGEYGGRILKAPEGSVTRPTTDRVRESLMSALTSALGSWEGLTVLDAFAGSGALGIEALSRGADYVLFCEQDVKVLRVLQKNLETLGIPKGAYTLWRGDTFFLASATASFVNAFDVVFLDPPYNYSAERIAAFVETLDAAGFIASGCVITYEYAKKSKLFIQEAMNRLEYRTVFEKSYGRTCVVALRKE